jgi:hypothetical protein
VIRLGRYSSRARASSRASSRGIVGFSPSQIPGLKIWLDSALGITLNGSTVSAWADQSGNGNNFTNPSGTSQPIYSASDANYAGAPSLGCAGAQYIDCVNNLGLAQPVTWVVAGKLTSTGTYLLAAKAGTSQQIYNNAGNLDIYAGTALNSTTSMVAPCVMGAIMNGASSASYINNSGTAAASGNAGANGVVTPELGAATQSSGFATATIASVLLYSSALTPSQMHSLFSYLGARYGIAAA